MSKGTLFRAWKMVEERGCITDFWWKDTRMYFSLTFLSTFFAALILSLGVKSLHMNFLMALDIAMLAILPSMEIFVYSSQHPAPVFCCASLMQMHAEEMAKWLVISAFSGIMTASAIIWIWRKRRNEK